MRTLALLTCRTSAPNRSRYKDVPIRELINKIKTGTRLARPDGCPEVWYDQVLLPCWAHNEHERPSFADLVMVASTLSDFGGGERRDLGERGLGL